MPLTSQLDYYRQLQIMHCQRERDIEQLYRQHQIFQQHQHQQQQQQQQDHPPSHAIQRGLLAQRMLQLQRLFQAQQFQKMQAMHKMGRAAPSASAPSSPSPSPSSPSTSSYGLLGSTTSESGVQEMSSEPRAETGLAQQQQSEKKNHDPNTFQLATATTKPSFPAAVKTTRSVPELAMIVLPSPDQIRKQRQQRLKYQARLRQAASASVAAKTKCAQTTSQRVAMTTASGQQQQQLSMPVSPPASPSPYSNPDFTPTTPHSPSFASFSGSLTTTNIAVTTEATAAPLSPMTPTMPTTPKESPYNLSSVPLPSPPPKVQPAVWTSSTTSLVHRSKADLQYRRQLRHRLAIQQHLIQDHTHRYRLFQAFCLLQRAQAAQAMEEVQTQRQRQLHTVAWVHALRQSQSLSQLEVPQ
ncbi:hypothetical protein BGZ96_001008 [Linnemannia gamsii]|uniref:Uncharacterized protein n=1 Tax=Linnemannia gamsii TaxID=64522 RepID=A0ABQ7JMZ2_9FUNG|nr:hypothetical protein BGZ96_001008 [Linnemannia gamsii]